MGAVVAKVIDAVSPGSEEQKMAKDTLNSLIDLGTAQSDLFSLRILQSGNSADKLIPIKKIIKSESIIRANAGKDANTLKEQIGTIVDDFAGGSTKEGIKNLFNVAIQGLFGSMSGSSNRVEKYLIAIGPLGGIYRVDYLLYTYKFEAEKLVKVVENVVVTSLVISSVDTDQIDPNTLKVIIQNTYNDSEKDLMRKIYDECLAELKKIEEDKKMIVS